MNSNCLTETLFASVETKQKERKGDMMKIRNMVAMVVCGLMVAAMPAKVEAAGIEIDGLDGAQHWVWSEAEYADSLSSLERKISDYWGGQGNSGHASSEGTHPDNGADKIGNTGSGVAGGFSFTTSVTLPADMTDARIYVRNAANGASTARIYVDDLRGDGGSELGTTSLISDSTPWNDPTKYSADVALGTQAQGAHDVQVYASSGWYYGAYDGFFISDGALDITTGGTAPGVATDGTLRWMTAPSAVETNTIVSHSVTPVLTITGTNTADTVEYSLNGVAYTPGTPIDDFQDHQLTVVVFDNTTELLGAGTTMRFMAGANFTLTPPQGTVVSIR